MGEHFSCPVCGRKLCQQLPNIEDFYNEKFNFSKDFYIADSIVMVNCTFYHDRDEDEDYIPLKVPHRLRAAVQMLFDSEGTCIAFDIVDLSRASDSSEDGIEIRDRKEVVT